MEITGVLCKLCNNGRRWDPADDPGMRRETRLPPTPLEPSLWRKGQKLLVKKRNCVVRDACRGSSCSWVRNVNQKGLSDQLLISEIFFSYVEMGIYILSKHYFSLLRPKIKPALEFGSLWRLSDCSTFKRYCFRGELPACIFKSRVSSCVCFLCKRPTTAARHGFFSSELPLQGSHAPHWLQSWLWKLGNPWEQNKHII